MSRLSPQTGPSWSTFYPNSSTKRSTFRAPSTSLLASSTARWDLCAVLNEEQRGEASTPAEPHLTLDDLGTRLKKRDHLAVTTTAGRFLGVVLRSDVERKMIEREHFVKN